MRISRLEISHFRGFKFLVLVPRNNVVVVGEPRAGRSDLLAAIRRVLDPRSTQSRPSEWDLHRSVQTAAEKLNLKDAESPLTFVEVTLVELPDETEQTLEDRLELFSPTTGEPVGAEDADDGVLGVRIRYCLRRDSNEQSFEHWVEYPRTGQRVPRSERELLKAFVLDRTAPLQLRAEGALRRLASDANAAALQSTLDEFSKSIAASTKALAESDEIRAALRLVAEHGVQNLLDLDAENPTAPIGFSAEDGSLAALLRAVQPTLELDDAGVLPLSSHGSTTSAIIAAAEAAAAAQIDDLIVLADDFGDQLDAASAEYLAARLRRRGGQLWLTTRQPEVLRAFEPNELIRLTRSSGVRVAFQLAETTDKKERMRRRYLHSLLSSAMSARKVILLEGPHDLATYTAVSERLFREQNEAPLAAYGMRLVSTSVSGGEGGKQELPKLARLAGDVGLAVRVVLDHDKPGTDGDLIDELSSISEMVVRLPIRAAVERTLVKGIDVDILRKALEALNDDYGLGLEIDELQEDDVAKKCVWALKQKNGLHKAFVDVLPKGVIPPLASEVLRRLKADTPDKPLVEMGDL